LGALSQNRSFYPGSGPDSITSNSEELIVKKNTFRVIGMLAAAMLMITGCSGDMANSTMQVKTSFEHLSNMANLCETYDDAVGKPKIRLGLAECFNDNLASPDCYPSELSAFKPGNTDQIEQQSVVFRPKTDTMYVVTTLEQAVEALIDTNGSLIGCLFGDCDSHSGSDDVNWVTICYGQSAIPNRAGHHTIETPCCLSNSIHGSLRYDIEIEPRGEFFGYADQLINNEP
jgi:hypothetical protein